MSKPGPETIHTILRAVLNMGGSATIQQIKDKTGNIYLGNLLRACAQASTDAGHLTRERVGVAYLYHLTDAGRAEAQAEYSPPVKARKSRQITPPPDLQAQRHAAAEMRRAELATAAQAKLSTAECAIAETLMDGPVSARQLMEAVQEATHMTAATIVAARHAMQARGEVEMLTSDHAEYPGRRRDELPVYRLTRKPCTLPTHLQARNRAGGLHAA